MKQPRGHISRLTRHSPWWIALACALLSFGCTARDLTQADLENFDALIQQYKSASKTQRAEAVQWLRNADGAANERRWDISAKMYAESAMRWPSFRALNGRGEALAKSDRKRATVAESIKAQKIAFDEAAIYFHNAVRFAEKVPEQAQAAELEVVRQRITCIESYAGGATHNCEPVRSVLLRYPAKL